MPKVVFYYFNVKSLGEGARMMLTYGDQEFEDRRVSDEEWPALKPSMPFGQMPVMVIDGKQYAQSFAISRYLGRKYGLSGKDIEEDFEIDQNMEYVKDIYATGAIVQYETDEVVREKKHKDFTKNVYPAMLDKLDEIIKKNNGHLAAGKITWADFMFTGVLDYIKTMLRMPDLEKKYPSYQQVIDNVYAIPKIAAYKKNAPETEF